MDIWCDVRIGIDIAFIFHYHDEFVLSKCAHKVKTCSKIWKNPTRHWSNYILASKNFNNIYISLLKSYNHGKKPQFVPWLLADKQSIRNRSQFKKSINHPWNIIGYFDHEINILLKQTFFTQQNFYFKANLQKSGHTC